VISSLRQSLRFAIVGLTSNLALYLLYLLLTSAGFGPKIAMTLLYMVGVAQTFVFNKRWTFAHQGTVAHSLLRYLAVYGFGYLLNFLALSVLVDGLCWPHALVQGAAIPILAVGIFLAQKFWVFSQDTGHDLPTGASS